MKKVTKEELSMMKAELEKLQRSIEKQEKTLEELKQNDYVISFIYANHEYQNSLTRINTLKEEIPHQEMLNCEHFFVQNKYNSYFDGNRSVKWNFVTCIKCGLTNKYLFNCYGEPNITDDEEQIMMNEIFNESEGTIYGCCDYDELDFYKDEYEKFKNEYPTATNDDTYEHIKLIKKMKEGKKC